MSPAARFLNAAEAASRLGVSVKALRLYERRGLITPGRTAAGWRAYGPEESHRVVENAGPRARGLVEGPFDPPRASRVASGEFSWTEPAPGWDRAVRELAVVLTADWERLGLTA